MTDADRYVSLGMYPLEPLRPAWETLWSAVQRRVPTLPPVVRWDVDVHDAWRDPACVVSHACGWPVATTLRDEVAVVGAFSLTIPRAVGHRYRTLIVASGPPTPWLRDAPMVRAAASSADSLSGWISLGAWAGGDGWPGTVTWTGSHVASLAALRAGTAEVASIDPLTWALLGRVDHGLVDGLHVIGHGPLVPSPPLVVPASTDTATIAALREAWRHALCDATATGARDELAIDGFVPLDHHDYAALPSLTSSG